LSILGKNVGRPLFILGFVPDYFGQINEEDPQGLLLGLDI